MDIVYVIFTTYLALGVALGYVYQLKKPWVLTGMTGGCGIYSILVFAGISVPNLEGMLNSITIWATKMGNGGLGLPVGVIVGQDFARRLGKK